MIKFASVIFTLDENWINDEILEQDYKKHIPDIQSVTLNRTKQIKHVKPTRSH